MTSKSNRGRPSTAQQKIKAKNAKEATEQAATREDEPIGLENDMESESDMAIPQDAKTEEAPLASPEQEHGAETAYHCLNCQSPVSRTDVRCPVCELKLQWEYMDVAETT
jgi:hypothetical protein